MRKIIGNLIMVIGVLGGLYLGIWVMFIGGITQFISSVTPVIIPSGIAIGIFRIMGSGIVGWVVGIIVTTIGAILRS